MISFGFTAPLICARLVFMAELLVGETMLVVNLHGKKHLPLRVIAALAVCFALALLMSGVQTDALTGAAVYFILFFCTLCAMRFCFSDRFFKLMFCAVAGYTLQHIAYEFFELSALAMGVTNLQSVYGSATDMFFIFGSNGQTFVSANPVTVMLYAFLYGTTYFFGYLFARRRLKNNEEFGISNTKMLIIAAIILFFNIMASAFIAHFSRADFHREYLIMLDLFNVACCFFSLYLQFDVNRRERLELDLSMLRRLTQERERQYEIAKENVDLINQKCHDLKYQIRRIGSGGAIDGGVIGEIENLVSIYDAPLKTGNESLDIILTEKSFLCNKNGIKLCCIIDGAKLDFMNASDLYALFGNIIDNAVEAVSPLPDGEKVISLSVKQTNDFLVVNAHNYYRGKLVFDGGLPRTTKNDPSVHGYGMKSVMMICKKYGGEFSITAKNQVFNLNIVFHNDILRT